MSEITILANRFPILCIELLLITDGATLGFCLEIIGNRRGL
jgi:hypothetical protein